MHAYTHETRSQRAARQRRQAAERARNYRLRRKEERRPLPRAVDAAITEALAFVMLDATDRGIQTKRVAVSTLRIGQLAVRILEHSGYDKDQSRMATAERLMSWERDHRSIGNVPTVNPSDHQIPDRAFPRGAIPDEWASDFMDRWQTPDDDDENEQAA